MTYHGGENTIELQFERKTQTILHAEVSSEDQERKAGRKA